AIHTGANTGLTSRNWNGTTAHQGSELVEPPPAMLAETSRWGQSCATCQRMNGANKIRAIIAPSQGYGLRSTWRGPTTTRLTSTATASSAGSGLFNRPRPTTRPAANQSRSSRSTARTISHVAAVQHSRSNVVVLSRWPLNSTTTDTPEITAASTWAPS